MMAYNPNKNLKIYYSIGEVAKMLGVNESLLRHWEGKFPQIAPVKAGRGIRQYREEDVRLLKQIYHLVKEKKMTLAGAKQRLDTDRAGVARNFEVLSRLKEIREELLGIKKELDA